MFQQGLGEVLERSNTKGGGRVLERSNSVLGEVLEQAFAVPTAF